MKLFKYFSLFLLGAVFFNACDKVDEPYGTKLLPPPECEEVVFPYIDQASAKKIILLEEITGHNCQNCPSAHATLQQILGGPLGEQLAVTAMHGVLADPSNPPLETDYRTDDGNTLITTLTDNGAFAPMGFINRTQTSLNNMYWPNEWENKIAQLAAQSPEVYLQVINTYDEVDNDFCCNVKTTLFRDFDTALSLSMYLTENNLVSGQNDGGNIIPDYVHKHVFRKAFVDVWGVPVDIKYAGDTLISTYKFELDPAWDAANCNVVAFISNSISKEIIQAAESHVVE